MSPKYTRSIEHDIEVAALSTVEGHVSFFLGPREPEWYDEMFPELDEDFDDDELEEEFEYDNEDY